MIYCPGLRLALLAYIFSRRHPVIARPEKSRPVEGDFVLETGYTAQISLSIGDFDEKDWDRASGNENLFISHRFLSAFERSVPANISFRYVMLRDKSKPVAVFYFQVIHLSADEIAYILSPLSGQVKSPGLLAQWSEWLRKTREEKGFRLLVSGNNFISGEYGQGMSKEADKASVFRSLAETVKLITRQDRFPAKISAILVKDFFTSAQEIPSDELRKKRYYRFQVEPEMIVRIPENWKTFGDYLAAMAKKYRNRAKSVMKKSERLFVEEPGTEALQEQEQKLYQLYLGVHERAKFRLAALGPNYFSEMKKAFPDEFRVFTYRLGNEIVAFRSYFRLGTHLEAHFIGFNYDLNTDHCLYQRILYDYVNDGIETRVPAVYLGRTAAEIKSTVGAEAQDLVCYIRHRNGLSNQVIRPFIDYLKPSPWVPRNPFKEENQG